MLFNSYVFLFFFLPLTLVLYYLLPMRSRLLLLTGASYIFYGWWDARFLLRLIFTSCLDYYLGTWIHRSVRQRTRMALLVASLASNLGMLGFFKYFRLAATTVNACVGHPLLPLWNITLPVGISFYTFQSLSYTIDIYRQRATPARNLLEFLCFVSLFPQLVAGPIVRWADLQAQLRTRAHTVENAARGCTFFAVGLAKKVLLADTMGLIADRVFNGGRLGVVDCWLAVLAFSQQIYFDFSGYSDIAIGLGLFFGFEFPVNFNSPYQSKSLREFWTRWHISLSTWLRDDLYIPLGGNRHGRARTLRNLMITMLLGGLWHGAKWTFVAWGAYHGMLLIVEAALGQRNPARRWPSLLQMAGCYLLVTLGWVLFRCQSLAAAGTWLATMSGFSPSPLVANLPPLWLVALLAASVLLCFCSKNTSQIRWRYTPLWAVASSALLIWTTLVILARTRSPFLYFQF